MNISRFNWPLVILAYFSLFCIGIADNARGAIYPSILNILGLSYDNGAILFSISSLTGLVSTLSARFWLPKYGIILPQRFFSLLLIFATLIFALSISLFPSFLLALAGCSLIGITMGGLSITMNLSINKAVPQEYRRKFLSGLHSLYGLSSGFAPIILVILASLNKSYQWLYFVISFFPVLLLTLSFWTRDNTETKIISTQSPPQPKIQKFSASNVILGTVLSFYVCSEVLLSSRFILIINSLTDIEDNAAQSYLTIFFIFLTIGRLIFAFIKTKKSNYMILLTSIILSIVLFNIAIITGHPIFLSLIGLAYFIQS